MALITAFLYTLLLILVILVLGSITYIVYYRITEKSKKFNSYTTAAEAINGTDLTNKYCIVTGSNSGIGKETAKILYKQGCNVIMACRNLEKANKALNYIKNSVNSISKDNELIVMELDLSSLQSTKDFAFNFTKQYPKLNFLINNAGLMMSSYNESKDGFERQFGVNHLGHFYLANLLLPTLIKNKTRVIVVSSDVANFLSFKEFDDSLNKWIQNETGPLRDEYDIFENYMRTKVANILFAREFNKRYSKDGIISVSLHPGAINSTAFSRDYVFKLSHIPFLFKVCSLPWQMNNSKNISQGAATTLRCVALTDNEIKGGDYYINCQSGTKYGKLKGAVTPREYDNYETDSLEVKLWKLSEILLKQKGFEI